MPERKPEDWLREQYFDLLPEVRGACERLETEVRYHLLPVIGRLRRYEQISVHSRIKACESAIDSLRRRQNPRLFDPELTEQYSILDLSDLAGVRILAFPRSRRTEINELLLSAFPNWRRGPFRGDPTEDIGYKYSGFLLRASFRVRGEYQIVSMLIGMFWEVEHAAIYKAAPELRGAARLFGMQERTRDVLRSLAAFEDEFEKLLDQVRS